ncbi:sigma-70 family RNA polymerase sigma factor [Clostridium felsineum]|uniref:RNA polymerase sigma factor SigA n=2 Tax=Clostridium felsineum TaxID=36839 RepID=A0A1S8LPH9_9CLOT|nr:sigma-70 family RNA polymerase sigma factor [Clostridium felsineum]URZ00617.1 RNA polymerase sigma factor SigA [Clostridium felsineum]URZ11775.1 RNA polymerase sigma factor SigA [Clostridium felsineum]
MKDNELKMIIVQAKAGDNDAKTALINDNIKYVKKIANNFCLNNKGLSLEDLIQEGIIAIIKAINSYDLNKNVKFSTYVYKMINFILISEIKKKYSYFKLPEHQVSKVVRFRRKAFELKLEDYCYKYSCEKMGLSYKEYANMIYLSNINNISYLNGKKSFDKKVSIGDKLSYEDINYKKVEERIDLLSILSDNKEILSCIERYILYRVIINDEKIKSISEVTKMSTKQISNIKYNALKKIQNNLKNKKN